MRWLLLLPLTFVACDFTCSLKVDQRPSDVKCIRRDIVVHGPLAKLECIEWEAIDAGR